MKKVLLSALVALAMVSFCHAQVTVSAFRDYDLACPIQVKYIGSDTSVATGTLAATSVVMTFDGCTITKAFNQTYTVADLTGWINSITNGDGHLVFKAAQWEALGTDLVSNKLMLCTNTIDQEWNKFMFKWDTSGHLAYNVICDIPNSAGSPIGNYEMKQPYGLPTGTGNLTLYVYSDDTLIFEDYVTSPYYVSTSVGTTNTWAEDTVRLATFDFPGIRIPAGKRGLVRAARATSATTGGIGVSITGNR